MEIVKPGVVIPVSSNLGNMQRNSLSSSDSDHSNLHDYFKNSTTDSIYDQKYIQTLVNGKFKPTSSHQTITKIPKGKTHILGSQYTKPKKVTDKLSEGDERIKPARDFDNPDSSFDRNKKLVVSRNRKHQKQHVRQPQVPKLDLTKMSNSTTKKRIKIMPKSTVDCQITQKVSSTSSISKLMIDII